MKKFLSIVVLLFGFSIATVYHYKNVDFSAKIISIAKIFRLTVTKKSIVPVDKAIINTFFKNYPDFKKYQSDVDALYKNRDYNSIWYNKEGLIEFANLLYSKVNRLEEDGLKSSFAYEAKINRIFTENPTEKLSRTDTEIMLTTMYVFYAQKVFHGIDTEKIRETGWFLPRKTIFYKSLLDSLLADPKLLSKNERQLFGQYYKLREVLKKYRQIEKNGAWNPIETDPLVKNYRPNDSSRTIGQIRQHLAITGDLKRDSKSNLYDEELKVGILNYKKRNGYRANYTISIWHIQRMNIPIEELIRTIMVNMERCRWISPKLAEADKYLIINIPAFKLDYYENGENKLESKVFVGKDMNETVIFSGNISSIVFSPYWNIPRSIIENELSQAMEQDKNYLESNNMEWNNGNIRQKPGGKNPLGLVKFVFPNTNDIYLHDTPSKSMFKSDYRAFSHGCINMDKAKELAVLILQDNPDWPIERIDEAMKGEKQTICLLKNKIPLYIGYFTAWVDDSGEISFYNDVYQKDDRLAELLFSEYSK